MTGRFELVESVTDAFAELAAGLLAAPREGRFSLCLSGGPTAKEAYRRLAERTGAGGEKAVDWTTVDVYLGDERCVPPDHADSNHKMITEVLLDQVGPVGSDHPMYRSGPPADAAAAYQAEIEPLGAFDLVHLGLGPDGHCASLFPDSPALACSDPDVLVMDNRDPHGNNPHDRITLTLPGIARSRLVVFTVSGESKRPALARIRAGTDLPAARVTATEVRWLVDAAAAGDTDLGDRRR
ncbi:MAG TPA: 6-phosphogluconolactonase [Acidimicrobiales bacterium]|jgi:6-phosphogluconolactonase|nr:6-phosphogluconolactonase [Acidimicrobiales bacterium]